MAINGKEARRKARAGELKPMTAIKHTRPFSRYVTRHGSLDRGTATQPRVECLIENDKLRTIQSASSSQNLKSGRRETTSRLTTRSVHTVDSAKTWYADSEEFKQHVDRLHTGSSIKDCKSCNLKGKKEHCWPEDKFGNPDYKKFRARRHKRLKRS